MIHINSLTGVLDSPTRVGEILINAVYKWVKITLGEINAVIQPQKGLYVKEFQIPNQLKQSDHVQEGDIDIHGTFKTVFMSVSL